MISSQVAWFCSAQAIRVRSAGGLPRAGSAATKVRAPLETPFGIDHPAAGEQFREVDADARPGTDAFELRLRSLDLEPALADAQVLDELEGFMGAHVGHAH